MTTLAQRIGFAIMHRRESLDMTQASLADRAGVTRNFINLIESGRRTPTVKTLERITEALGSQARLVLS